MNHITAKTMQVNALTLPSETIFATKLKVLTLFGIPRYVQAGGLSMDADHLVQVVKSKDGNADTVKQYMLGSGMTSSALEHSVPEQLFSTPDNPAEAISTVKALQIANDQGIPIYTVNQNSLAAVLPQLQIDSQIKTDIQNAVNAGKVVTVSKSNISFNGWNGCGYIITDPETGAGAYMISGGTSGADIVGSSGSSPPCDLCTPFFKSMVWVIASLISVIAIFMNPVVGAVVTVAMPFITTAILKMVCRDYTVSAKDVLLYVTSVVGWTTIGVGVLAVAGAGVSLLLAIPIMIMMLLSILLLDLIITFASNYRRQRQDRRVLA